MRKFKIKPALSTPQHKALVFFALSLDEQLYDLTDDSFKAPALNTYTRTFELQAVASANHSAGISKDALTQFLDELEWSVSKDPVLSSQQKALCKLHLTNVRENAGEQDRIVRGASGLRTILGDYYSDTVNKIRETIKLHPKNKADLSSLAATFIVQAETEGWPRRHTYHVAQNSLIRHLRYEDDFNPDILLDDFFSGFPPTPTNFNCLFIGSSDFENYPKLLDAFGISVLQEAPLWEGIKPDQQRFLDSKANSQRFLHIKEISTKSPAQAHQFATDIFEEFIAIVKFFEHKLSLAASDLSLVRDDSTNRIYSVHNAPDPMHCWVSHTGAGEDDLMDFVAATHGNHLSDIASSKLRRTIRLHRSALQSSSAENQLIDLWAGLEGLVSRPGKESQRLQFFSECLLPAITLTYPEKLFISAYRDLSRVAPRARGIALDLPGTDSGFSKFVRIVLCADHTTQRASLINLLEPHPLLLNKIWRLSENFKSRSATQQTLRKHRQKVSWHLARIYHTRNSIMHNATALPHLATLVENLHFYVDTLVKAIQKTAKLSPERITIDGALQYLSMWEKYRLHSITHDHKNNDNPPNDSDVWAIVFGENLALAPRQDGEPLFPGSK